MGGVIYQHGPPLCNNSFVRHLIYVRVITDQEYQDVLHDVEPDVPQVHVTGGRVMEANRPQSMAASLYTSMQPGSNVGAETLYSRSVTPGQPREQNLICII